MAIDERQRHELYRKLEDTIGQEHASLLMSMLPPVGWADVATKDDLSSLGRELSLKIEAAESRLEAKLESALRQQLWATIGVMLVAVLASLWLGR